MPQIRQKLLLLYLHGSDLNTPVIGWTLYDGTGKDVVVEPVDANPPYPNAVAAMRDGWRVIQMPVLHDPPPGAEWETGYLKFEVILEKLETIDG